MASLTFLGTACGVPMVGRGQTAHLLQAHGEYVLVDAGEPCSRVLREIGVPFNVVSSVLITHGHSDHIGGLPMFLQACWVEQRTSPLTLFLPGELIDPLRAWLTAVYLPPDRLGFPLRFEPWRAGQLHEVAGLHVTPQPTTHLDGLRELFAPGDTTRFHAFSLQIGWAGMRMVISGDLGAPSDLDPHLATPVDLLVCELSHFSPTKLFAYLRSKTIRRLALTHYSSSERVNAERILREARELLPRIEEIRDMGDGDTVEF